MSELNNFISETTDHDEPSLCRIPLRRKTKSKPITTIDYSFYLNNNDCVRTLRIKELKLTIKNFRFGYCTWHAKISRHYDFMLSGSKPILIARILNFFNQTRCAVAIQRIIRGCFTRTFFKIRKYTHTNNDDRVVCVNDTDFFSLDDVKDIPYKLFFSYTDKNNFTYGFNILSLMHLYLKRDEFKNPYNRDEIPRHVLATMVCIYNLIGLLFPGTIPDFSPMRRDRYARRRVVAVSSGGRRRIFPTIFENSESLYVIEPELLTEIRMRMIYLRDKILSDRVEYLFSEINRLGNDSHFEWFNDLTKEDYYRLYDVIDDLWRNRLQLPIMTKSKICPMGSPFNGSRMNESGYVNTSIDDVRKSCIFVMENMVFSGVDDDYRKIGSLQVLTALTSVSIHARNAISYLYESLV